MAIDYDKELDSIQEDLDNLHDNKVDVVQGKQLSTNDFTDEHLRKVNRIETKEYHQEIVAGVAKDLQQANDNHVRLADEVHRHIRYGSEADNRFKKEVEASLKNTINLVRDTTNEMSGIKKNLSNLEKEGKDHEGRLTKVEGQLSINGNIEVIKSILDEQVIQNNQIKGLQDKNVELETRVEVSDADQNHRLNIVENRIGTFTDKITSIEDGYAQRDARLDGLYAQVSRCTEIVHNVELTEKAQNDRIKAEEEKNKRQDIDIACLYAEVKDKTITIDTEGTAVELQNSKEGDITINSIEGNTMVNCKKDVDKELTLLTSSVDVSADNSVTLTEGVVDGGLVDVYLGGNTLVNVSKTKDSTTITKAYTVENSGNHIALQGDVDGICRPVVTGKTLVNLIDIKGNENISGNTVYSTVTDTEFVFDWSKGQAYNNWMQVRNNVDLIQEGKTYTVIINILENNPTLDGAEVNGEILLNTWFNGFNTVSQYIPYGTTGLYKYTFSAVRNSTQTQNIIGIKVNSKADNVPDSAILMNGGKLRISRDILVLEGNYTNKPIPDYFEGLQSSFEDNLLLENLYKFSSRNDFYLLDDIVVLEGEYIKMSANSYFQNAMLKPLDTIKPSTTYTIVVEVVENTLNSKLLITARVDDAQLPSTTEKFQINAGETGIFKHVTTTGTNLSGCTRCLVNYLDSSNTKGSIKYRIMVVEGDYVSGNLGKYKVEYRVTGKNLVSNIIPNCYQNYNATNNNFSIVTSDKCSVTDFIRVIPGKTYIGTGLNGGGAYYDKNKNPILPMNGGIGKPFIVPSGAYYLRANLWTNPTGEGNIQVEEGDTATSYEPYKEYTKTLYLNSPLLEGSTI